MKQFEDELKRVAEAAKEVFGGNWISVSVDTISCYGSQFKVQYSLSIGFGAESVAKFATLDDVKSYIESRRSPYPRDIIHRKFSL